MGGSVGKFSSDCFYFLHEVGSKTASRVRRKERGEGKNSCQEDGRVHRTDAYGWSTQRVFEAMNLRRVSLDMSFFQSRSVAGHRLERTQERGFTG